MIKCIECMLVNGSRVLELLSQCGRTLISSRPWNLKAVSYLNFQSNQYQHCVLLLSKDIRNNKAKNKNKVDCVLM